MSSRGSTALCVGVIGVLAGMCLGAASGRPSMNSRPMRHDAPLVANAPTRSPEATEALFRGDMVAEVGLACGIPAVGPGEWATKVTATLTPPFGVITTSYDISGTAQTTWDLVAWSNGASPGSEIQRCPLGAANGTTGFHIVPVPPGCLTIPGATGQTFYFGLSQGTDTNGMRFGEDTSGATPNTVFVRNPGCGFPNWGSVESIGFPGYWVHRIIVDDTVPVELMNFSVQ